MLNQKCVREVGGFEYEYRDAERATVNLVGEVREQEVRAPVDRGINKVLTIVSRSCQNRVAQDKD